MSSFTNTNSMCWGLLTRHHPSFYCFSLSFFMMEKKKKPKPKAKRNKNEIVCFLFGQQGEGGGRGV